MSAEYWRTSEQRQKRVKWLKKCIIFLILLILLFPMALGLFLFHRLQRTGRELESLTARVEELQAGSAALQAQIQELLEKMPAAGGGSQEQAAADRERDGRGPDSPADDADVDGMPGAGAELVKASAEIDGTPDAGLSAAHKVYLTFDDGPSSNTGKILDILDAYHVKATFFVVGKEGEWAREALADIAERGHTLGMHSYSHRYADIYASVENFAEDFVKLRGYLEEVTGVVSDVYRFPGGSSNTVSDIDMHEFAEYLESWGVRFFDWNAASGDGGSRLLTVEELVENSLKGIRGRETTVILLHDAAGKPTTVEALPEILEGILAMEDTVILPITEATKPVQHIRMEENSETEVD